MIISSKNDLLKEIDTMLDSQSIRNITLLYPYINLAYKQSPQNLGQEILSKLQQTQNNIMIHSFEAFSQISHQPLIYQKRIATRRLLQCLNIIGQNNIRALYVGVNDDKPNDDNSHTPSQLLADTDSQDSSNQPHQDKKRPKLIGRLATTIIVEDGLWLG